MNEEVQLEVNDRKGFFYISIDGKTEAKMTFVFAGPNKIIIDRSGPKSLPSMLVGSSIKKEPFLHEIVHKYFSVPIVPVMSSSNKFFIVCFLKAAKILI